MQTSAVKSDIGGVRYDGVQAHAVVLKDCCIPEHGPGPDLARCVGLNLAPEIMRIFNVKAFNVLFGEPVDQRAWIAFKMCPSVRPGAPSPTVHAMPKECVVRAKFWDIGIVPSADVPNFGVFLVLAERMIHVG